jgi:hypothetical protein
MLRRRFAFAPLGVAFAVELIGDTFMWPVFDAPQWGKGGKP